MNSQKMLEKAMQCKTADELIALAKSGGYEITKEEADAYLAELSDVELNQKQLQNIAGGKICWSNTVDNCGVDAE